MANAISALSTTVTADALWGEFNLAIPIIGVVCLFVFGYTIVKRVTKGASKGRLKM